MAPALPIFDARYLITLDGPAISRSESVHAHCLTTTKNGTTRYHHDILQAAIVAQASGLPLAPEFDSDADGAIPQRIAIGGSRHGTTPASSPTPPPADVAAMRSRWCCRPGGGTPICDLAVLRRANLLDRHTTGHRRAVNTVHRDESNPLTAHRRQPCAATAIGRAGSPVLPGVRARDAGGARSCCAECAPHPQVGQPAGAHHRPRPHLSDRCRHPPDLRVSTCRAHLLQFPRAFWDEVRSAFRLFRLPPGTKCWRA